MTARILAILDRDPFPPRDGETVPIAAHLRAMAERWPVDLLFVGDEPPDRGELPILRLDPSLLPPPPNRLRSAWHELRGVRPNYVRPASPDAAASVMGDRTYDVIYVSPARMVEWAVTAAHQLASRNAQPPVIVLGLSDSLTQTFRRGLDLARLSGLPWPTRLRHLARSTRLLTHPRWERQLLSPIDLTLVQTEADREAIRRDCGDDLAERVIVTPNGLRESLLDEPYEGAESMALLHLGPVRTERKDLLLWFLDRVFRRLRRRLPEAMIHIAGDIDDETADQLRRRPGVLIHGFVDDLAPLMKRTAMSVVPVFMRCGLINKVVDSMAAGVPCSGIGAFNGFLGFVDGEHGIAARSAHDWAARLASVLHRPDELRAMSAAGRELVAAQFRWERTAARLCESIASRLARRQAA